MMFLCYHCAKRPRGNRTPVWYFSLFLVISILECVFCWADWYYSVWAITTGLWFCVMIKFQAGLGLALSRVRRVALESLIKHTNGPRKGVFLIITMLLALIASFFPLYASIFMVFPALLLAVQVFENLSDLLKMSWQDKEVKAIGQWQGCIILLILVHFLCANVLFWGCYFCEHDSAGLPVLSMSARTIETLLSLIIISSDFFH